MMGDPIVYKNKICTYCTKCENCKKDENIKVFNIMGKVSMRCSNYNYKFSILNSIKLYQDLI